MRVLLVGDGVNELHGALQSIVARVCTKCHSFQTEMVKNIRATQGRGDGFFKKAIASATEARKRGCDAVVFLIDEDGDGSRVAAIDKAQANEVISEFPHAFGVAIRRFDAWILADERLRCQEF